MNKNSHIESKSTHRYERVVRIVSNYYWLNDLENGTINHKIFNELYIEKKYDNYDLIAQSFGIDIRTLYNYRKKYKKILDKLLYIAQNVDNLSEISLPIQNIVSMVNSN